MGYAAMDTNKVKSDQIEALFDQRRLDLLAAAGMPGGYAFKRYKDKQDRRTKARPKVKPSAA